MAQVGKLVRPSRSACGLRKNFTVKVIFRDGSVVVRKSRASPGMLLNRPAIDKILDDLAVALLAQYSDREFRLVELAGGNCNFVEIEARKTADSRVESENADRDSVADGAALCGADTAVS